MPGEPLLTGELTVGRARFRPKVKLATAQGSIDRLYERYCTMESVLREVKALEARLPDELRHQINDALGLRDALQ